MTFPLLSLLANELGRRSTDHDRLTALDPFEDVLSGGTRYLALEDLLDERRERQVPSLCASNQLVVQAVWHVSDLNHLGHAPHMLSHALHM